MFPVILILGIYEYEQWFVWLLITNLITDILDGLIARTFNMQTEIGAKIDSIADTGTYILAIFGVFQFKYSDFEPHLFSFLLFIGLFLACNLLSLVKFKQMPSLHLYSWKLGGYIQGSFFFVLFAFGFNEYFYWFWLSGLHVCQ